MHSIVSEDKVAPLNFFSIDLTKLESLALVDIIISVVPNDVIASSIN